MHQAHVREQTRKQNTVLLGKGEGLASNNSANGRPTDRTVAQAVRPNDTARIDAEYHKLPLRKRRGR